MFSTKLKIISIYSLDFENNEWFRNVCEDLDKFQDFDNQYQVSRLYNNETIHQVEVISFLYKREMHWVINENTKEARMKDLDKMGFKDLENLVDFERQKSTLISRF